MSEQYIVAVHLDFTLVVDACGPFRSRRRAGAAAEKINDAGEWAEMGVIAQVVRLRPVDELVKEAQRNG